MYDSIQIIPDSYEQVVRKDKGVSVHRLTEFERSDCMITEGKELDIVSGPSNEELFDCERLGNRFGSKNSSLHAVEFWAQEGNSGARVTVRIEGTSYAGDNGREWFFWGRMKLQGSGSTWTPVWKAPDGYHVFGRWNTYHRRGVIKFGKE